jgi:heme/copper-type cytochrome/quinol oxidase subunit 2
MAQVKLRSPLGVFFLAAITGGIYYFYWFYRVNEEAAILSRDESANPGLSLLATTLGILLIVPLFWTHWTTAKRVGTATGQPPGKAANIAFSIVLLPFASLLYTLWLQGKLNKHGRRERMAASPPLG